jgi:Ca2+-dependent lipid-binding protein
MAWCIDSIQFADGVGGSQQQSANFWDCSDPYVELSCGKTSQKTKVINNNLNPEFNETFEFSVSPMDQILTIKVWDYDSVKSDDLLGTLEIPLFKLKAGEIYNQW